MKYSVKKFVAFLLTLVMMINMMPVSGLADQDRSNTTQFTSGEVTLMVDGSALSSAPLMSSDGNYLFLIAVAPGGVIKAYTGELKLDCGFKPYNVDSNFKLYVVSTPEQTSFTGSYDSLTNRAEITTTPAKFGGYIFSYEDNPTTLYRTINIQKAPYTVQIEYQGIDGILDPVADPGDNLYIIAQKNSNAYAYAPIEISDGVASIQTFYGADNSKYTLPEDANFWIAKYKGPNASPTLSDLIAYDDNVERAVNNNDSLGLYTYTFPNAGADENNVFHITARKRDVYSVTLKIWNQEQNKLVVPGQGNAPAINEYGYARVLLYNNATTNPGFVGYAIVQISTNGSVNSAIVDKFKLFNSPVSDPSQASDGSEEINYQEAKERGYSVLNTGDDASKSVRIGHIAYQNPPNYQQFDTNGNGFSTADFDGYTFAGQDKSNPDERIINIRVADPSEYYVKIDCGSEALSIPESVDLYALVTVTNASGGKTYAYAKLNGNSTDGRLTYTVQIKDDKWWLDQYGSGTYVKIPKNQISGHETNMTVSLAAVPHESTVTSPADLINRVIAKGGTVQTHGVSKYPSIDKDYDPSTETGDPERIIERTPGVVVKYTDIVYLEKNRDTIDVYSLDVLMNRYNIVTLCRNDAVGSYGQGDFMDGNHIIGGILVRGDLIPNPQGNMTNIGSGVAATMPSVIGGQVDSNINFQFIGQGQDRPGRNNDLYIGSSNTVIGNYINGAIRDYNYYGDTVVSDSVVDWESLRRYVVSQSTMMKNTATDKTSAITTAPSGMAPIPEGASVLIISPGEKVKIDGNGAGLNIIIRAAEGTKWSEVAGTVITFLGTGENHVPNLYFQIGENGSLMTPKQVNEAEGGDYENAKGLSVVYNYPNASKVDSAGGKSGHVIAPEAEIYVHGGEFNGTMIGNQVKTGGDAEGHMWPYKGGDLIPADVTFNGNKTLDGADPGTKQFAFLMYQLDKTKGWDYVMTAYNKENGLIQFAPLAFTDQGDYYYLFFEDPDQNKPGYTLDPTKYVVHVKVTARGAGGDTQIIAEHTYYKIGELNDITALLTGSEGNYAINETYLTEHASTISLSPGQTSRDAIEFDNTEEKSGITITKRVVSPIAADHDAYYSFEITLTDTSISGTYSDVVFTNGRANVTVQGDHSKRIEGLPEATGYTITEITSSLGDKFVFDPASPVITGESIGSEGVVAAFTNIRKVGKVSVTKVVKDEKGDTISVDNTFTFTITNTADTSISTQLTVGAGETKTTVDLPLGTYTVVESETIPAIDGYEFTGVTYNPSDHTVTITEHGQIVTVTATNAYTKTSTSIDGEIRVKKELTGRNWDTDDVFTFTLAGNGNAPMPEGSTI